MDTDQNDTAAADNRPHGVATVEHRSTPCFGCGTLHATLTIRMANVAAANTLRSEAVTAGLMVLPRIRPLEVGIVLWVDANLTSHVVATLQKLTVVIDRTVYLIDTNDLVNTLLSWWLSSFSPGYFGRQSSLVDRWLAWWLNGGRGGV